MSEIIKQIVADFTKIPNGQLTSETRIDRSVISNSIVLHRMYAAIAKNGFVISDYQKIKTFGELLQKVSGKENAETAVLVEHKAEAKQITYSNDSGIGIDIEEISQMPQVTDFRQEEFYTTNFTSEEISYCSLQPDPYASFCGIFAVKEAIIKADNKYKGISFYKIFIDHSPQGKPFLNGFKISIAHKNNFAIAIAINELNYSNKTELHPQELLSKNDNRSFMIISVIALLLAVISICVCIFK